MRGGRLVRLRCPGPALAVRQLPGGRERQAGDALDLGDVEGVGAIGRLVVAGEEVPEEADERNLAPREAAVVAAAVLAVRAIEMQREPGGRRGLTQCRIESSGRPLGTPGSTKSAGANDSRKRLPSGTFASATSLAISSGSHGWPIMSRLRYAAVRASGQRGAPR